MEGWSNLWAGVPRDRRSILLRSSGNLVNSANNSTLIDDLSDTGFFVFFESEILQRAHKSFSYRNASLGNIALSSMQRHFLSLPAAIFLFSSLLVPLDCTALASFSMVIPCIETNHIATLAAGQSYEPPSWVESRSDC